MIHFPASGITISFWTVTGVFLFTGWLSGFLGVGGGFIRMPALIYLIGCPTAIAVGTDLFSVLFSGAYGCFTYGVKGRVEIIAAVLMLIGASIGRPDRRHRGQVHPGLRHPPALRHHDSSWPPPR